MRLRICHITMMLLSMAQLGHAQHANHWIFGENIHVEFGEDTILQHKISGVRELLEGTAAYSNALGDLKYYSAEKYYVRDGNHVAIEPAIAFDYTATQGVIITKQIEDSTFYIMTSMREGNSRWNLLENDSFKKYLQRFPFSGGEKQQAVNHQNRRDIWYANHAQNGDSIYFFLIKKDGLLECPVITHTGNVYENSEGAATQGQMKFSPDAKYLAEVTYIRPFSVGVYKFNSEYPSTDSIYIYSKGFTQPYTKRWFYGAEFSPNGQSLFVVSGLEDQQEPYPPILFQLVLDSLKQDIKGSSWISIDTLWNENNGALQLAPNGKIYRAAPGKKYLGVINNPIAIGSAVKYERDGLKLDSGGTCLYGLPTFNQSYFYHPNVEFSYKENCFTNTYSFTAQDSFSATSFEWVFTNSQTGKAEIKTGKSMEFQFTANGLQTQYEVKLIASNSAQTDSITKTITIRQRLTDTFLGRDSFYCAGEPFKLTLQTPADLHCIHWMGEEPEATIGGTIIRGYEHFHSDTFGVDTAGVYFARITNKAFCRAYDTITIEEKPAPPKPEISLQNKELVSSLKASKYRWFLNDSFLFEIAEKSLSPTKDGYYQVQLISEYGCESKRSDSFLFKKIGIEPLPQLHFNVYPNPTDGLLHIDFGEPITGTITIIDMTGKLVLTQNIHQRKSAELNIKTSGRYILKVVSDVGHEGRQVFQVR